MAEILAVIYAAVTALVVGFQLALALGAPWGSYAMGGAFPGRMPPAMRVAAVAQAVVLAGLAVIVLADAGLTSVSLVSGWPWLIWLPVVVAALAVGLNASTRSRGERRIWLPVALVLLGCSLGVTVI
ncbi:MAG TPA: hypothetical protein VFY43_06830 [Candidatus Limnocylindria bacterium]|nr:hypothetical protein [Candidatus Limnocylindria bacterium]